jgi:NADH-quinone oxidoreductase subunit M
LNAGFASVAAGGVVLAAVYLLLMFQRTFYGAEKPSLASLTDLKPWEAALGAGLAALIVVTGLAPTILTKPMESSIDVTRKMALEAPGNRPVWQAGYANVARGATAQR